MGTIRYRGETVGMELFGLKIYWKTYTRWGIIAPSRIYLKRG